MSEPKQKTNILTKELEDKSNMIRFVQGPERKIFADLSEKLPGRGLWVKADKSSLDEAISGNIFSKACKDECKADATLIEDVQRLLKERILSLISMSKKTGALTLGFDKVLDSVKESKIAIFIVASDSGEDGKSKIEHKIDDSVTIIDKFSGSELQTILGQDTVVVYGCIKKAKLSTKIASDYKKFLNFI